MRQRLILSALLLLSLGACSPRVFWTPTVPRLAANLAAPCPPLPLPPEPLTDPDRGFWEADMIAKYGDCAARHRATVDAWPKHAKIGFTGQKE